MALDLLTGRMFYSFGTHYRVVEDLNLPEDNTMQVIYQENISSRVMWRP